jgi:hypothetical protein
MGQKEIYRHNAFAVLRVCVSYPPCLPLLYRFLYLAPVNDVKLYNNISRKRYQEVIGKKNLFLGEKWWLSPAAQGIGGVRSSHGALRWGRSDSGAPQSPVFGACAENAPKFFTNPFRLVLSILFRRDKLIEAFLKGRILKKQP